MTSNRNKFLNTLFKPIDVAHITGSFLDAKSLSNISHACRSSNMLFEKALENKRVSILLKCAMNACPSKVNSLLISCHSESKHIMLERIKGTEPCGRKCI